MGIWEAAKRGEGYQFARDSNLTWVVVTFAIIGHFFFRFFSGRPLRGDDHRKTNATWNMRGEHVYNENRPTTRPPGWWSWLPERTRAGIRVGFLVVVIAISWGFWDGTPFTGLTHDTFTAGGVVLTWMALYKVTALAHSKFSDRNHKRDLIGPFKTALAPLLGVAPREVKVHIPPASVRGDKSA